MKLGWAMQTVIENIDLVVSHLTMVLSNIGMGGILDE